MSFLSVKDLSIGFNGLALMENINFHCDQGEMIPILGANGIGKSTLLKTIAGTIPKIGGEIFIESKKIKSFDRLDLAKKVSLCFPEYHILHHYSVVEMVMLGRYPYSGYFGSLDSHSKNRVKEVLSLFDLEYIKDQKFSELSSGQKQKTVIAKAFAQDSQLIMLDEPTNFLDIKNRYEVFELLMKLASEHNRLVVLTSHDIALCEEFCNDYLVIDLNKKVKKIKASSFNLKETFGLN